jgi:hypothetical protein
VVAIDTDVLLLAFAFHSDPRQPANTRFLVPFLDSLILNLAQIKELHDQYQRGDITLRGMARRLGLSYRELYEELEKRNLPI